MKKEKRYIKKSSLDKYSLPEWLIFCKLAEIYDFILVDDSGNVIETEIQLDED